MPRLDVNPLISPENPVFYDAQRTLNGPRFQAWTGAGVSGPTLAEDRVRAAMNGRVVESIDGPQAASVGLAFSAVSRLVGTAATDKQGVERFSDWADTRVAVNDVRLTRQRLVAGLGIVMRRDADVSPLTAPIRRAIVAQGLLAVCKVPTLFQPALEGRPLSDIPPHELSQYASATARRSQQS